MRIFIDRIKDLITDFIIPVVVFAIFGGIGYCIAIAYH